MRLLFAAFLVPAVASASGFYMSENGAKTLMMGGAFAGEADDLSAQQHNPAGLAQLRGFHFLLDGQLVMHNITFQRYDKGFDPANPPMGASQSQPVNNIGGPFLVPMIGAGYGLEIFDRTLFISLGLYGPPADGHYAFPKPNYERNAMGKYVETPIKYAPQRYSLVENTIFVIFPTLSVAFAPHQRFMIGVSLQPVLASFFFTQSVTSIRRVFTTAPQRQTDEDPFYDSVVKVNLPMQLVNFTFVAGALVRPTDWLQLGISFRPQVMINAKGKLEIELGEAAKALNTTVTPDATTTLSLRLPAELKIGVHAKPISKLGINFDFIYQGWQSVQEIVLDPQDVYLQSGTDPPQKVAGFRIQKHWNAAYNFRLGASYDLFPWLALYLGGWYETGAIPDEYLGVDFLHYSRVTFTGGLGVRLWGLELLVGAAGSPATTKAITESKVLAGSTEPDEASVIGYGVYTSGTFMVSFGLRGSFGAGAKDKPKLEELPQETPSAAPEKKDEPAPAPAPVPSSAEEAPKS